ncbi:RHS repeat-associated core domain-containing protein [Pseudomonas sp. NEEL19]|uniref:RHS repeat-associated core domain-containing protein n=1 Tax=Pseudomonas sp. NEEL19 TaxID=2867409 RepID=UPI0023684A5F|nr:RHS repeat-associated core domain-containing protein [Pseudomonas sp. NEEL19]WDM61065.1 RHS repeat-associated core domain-containing protein [Pseudomonas sp. NEEL19]
MQQKKQNLFYKKGQLSCEIGSQPATLFATLDIPLAQISAETQLTAVNSQNSIVNSSHGHRIQCLSYSAYGYSLIESILGYTGQRYDRFTNHYLLGNGYRAYSPLLMRFLAPDTLSPFDEGGRNAYAYCEGNPTNNVDPSGHMLKKVRQFFNSGPDALTPSLPRKSKYYSQAVAVTQDTPPLAKYPKWFDSPHTQKKHLKQAAKLATKAESLEAWSPNPDLHYLLTNQDQWNLAFDAYNKALIKTEKTIKKVYTPIESKIEIPSLATLCSENSKIRGAAK